MDLIICLWDPKFDLEEAEIEKVIVWVKLPGLPIKYYDHKFLTFLENRIGKTLKVDVITSEQTRGKYARTYVEIDLIKALLS